jgi:AAHS family 4-hydroxybenzoate transporter-like MFS transporter
MFMGITTGSAGVGLIAAYFMPAYGWPVIFRVGGVLPILVAVGLFYFLPESLKLLAINPERRGELITTARRMRPDLPIDDAAVFVNPPSVTGSEGKVKELLKGGLARITPLLWVCYTIALMANFFLNNTIPLIFDKYGLDPQEAALVATWYHAGGTCGGLVIAMLLDRTGFLIVAALFLLAVPSIALLGFEGMPFYGLALASGMAGVTILGAQSGNNAAAGLIYPTNIRGKGVGVALSVGRFGAILGPYAGAALLGMDITMRKLFFLASIPVLIGLVAALILSWLCYRRFNSFQLDDSPVEPTPE